MSTITAQPHYVWFPLHSLNPFSISVSTNGPPPPVSHMDKKSLDTLRDVMTPDLKAGKPSDVICIED